MKTVTKRVEGVGKIPKYNVYPPLQINDTESFFAQLKNVGFIVKDVEEKKLFPSQIKQMETEKEEKAVEVVESEPETPVVEEVKETPATPEVRPNTRRNTRNRKQ